MKPVLAPPAKIPETEAYNKDMKPTDKFTFKLECGSWENCQFAPGRYRDGNLALQVFSEEEGPICTLSVNPGEKLDDDVLCVKDYSENQGAAAFLRSMGIIGECVKIIPSGWVDLKVFELTEPGKELFEGV